jgi:polyhydroxyalkanoate synthesis regulator phasin
MAKSSIKRFLEAGAQFTEMSRERAEAIVKDMVKSGDVRAKDAERMIQTLVERGRDASERIAAGVQSEVAKQMASMQARFDELEAKIESLTRSLLGGARTPTPAPPAPPVQHPGPAKQAAPKNAAPRKATTKKSAAKKAGAKKAGSEKAGARKSGAKKSAAKKSGGASKSAATSNAAADSAVGTSGVRPIRTTRPD